MTEQTSPTPPPTVRQLRRSRDQRMLTGVAGGLADYFRVDPILLRVTFGVLAVFGGAGLLIYLLCWLLIPEPESEDSALDTSIGWLRQHRVQPWAVVIGGAIVLWLGWFSWWAPKPAFGGLAVAAVLGLVLIYRQRKGFDEPTTVAAEVIPEVPAGPPLAPRPGANSYSSMQAWFAESARARRDRRRRKRPIRLGTALALLVGWAAVAISDAIDRVPVPTYLWVGLAVVAGGFLVSVVTRRTMWLLLGPLAWFAVLLVAFGGTHSSLRDGIGQVGWRPSSAAELTDHREFAGQATLDLRQVTGVETARSITLTQAAGEVVVKVPAGLNVRVVSHVHFGDAQLGRAQSSPDYASGNDISTEMVPNPGATGAQLTVVVRLAMGHVQIDRVS